jgi:hypothetical protein
MCNFKVTSGIKRCHIMVQRPRRLFCVFRVLVLAGHSWRRSINWI